MAPPRSHRPPPTPAKPASPAQDVPLVELLAELGFTGRNEATARGELEKLGLTRPGKQRIAVHKRPEVERVLGERLVLLCGRAGCRDAALGERRIVLHTERPADCAQCGGSGNKQAVDRLCMALQLHAIHRLVVVGGSPSVREELRRLFAARCDLRLIDGTERRTRDEARTDLRWADLCVIWGGTELDHKVSTLYSDREGRIVPVHRRGIAALADSVREHLERHPPHGR